MRVDISSYATRSGMAIAPLSDMPLIAHVIFRLDVGGLENGLVNLINGMAGKHYRHAIICIDDYTDFSHRIQQAVEIIAIRKKPGTDPSALWRLYRAFRRLRPDIVHTRNLAALDALIPAFLAGVPCRIHSEHGWDVNDLHGTNKKLRLLRKLHAPFVHRYVALSRHLEHYLVERVGIAGHRVTRLYNGVDTDRFEPRSERHTPVVPAELCFSDSVLIGTIGRLQPVKDPLTLISAFALMVRENEELAGSVRLVIVGDGSLREAVVRKIREEGIQHITWVPGSRDDIPAILRSLDLFVLPSLAEGISNTILEAMASGIPVVANDVGGNSELVEDGLTGTLVPPGNVRCLADTMRLYVENPSLRVSHGKAGAERVKRKFSMRAMIDEYLKLYSSMHQLTAPAGEGK